MRPVNSLLRLVLFCLLIAGLISVWEQVRTTAWLSRFTRSGATAQNLVLTRITALGKLELVRYTFKDIVEHELVKTFLPNPQAVLIVEGEAVGCLDLTKINTTDLLIKADSVIIKLPRPELCAWKINHERSRIYDTHYAFLDESQLVSEAYRKAEDQIRQSALNSGILLQTRQNADQILRPLLEQITGKKVRFRD